VNQPDSFDTAQDYFISRTLSFIFKALCDDLSYQLLRKMVESDSSASILKSSSFEPNHEFSLLVRAGLIQENQGKFFPTPMGVEIYEHIRMLTLACNQFPRLQFIDSVSTINDIPQSEVIRIIDLLIKNNGFRRVLKENLELSKPDRKNSR
jgi:hypothetical protein